MIYELSRQAKADIKAIIRYTDRYFGEAQTTGEYVDGLFYSFGLLTDNPRMGREWDGDKTALCLPHAPCLLPDSRRPDFCHPDPACEPKLAIAALPHSVFPTIARSLPRRIAARGALL